jgi:hypothetical protein
VKRARRSAARAPFSSLEGFTLAKTRAASKEVLNIVPTSFVALFLEPGRMQPGASSEHIAERYLFCEVLATALVERAVTMQGQLGVSQKEILERLHASLLDPIAPVPPAQAEWIVLRLAEVLRWPSPFPPG